MKQRLNGGSTFSFSNIMKQWLSPYGQSLTFISSRI